MHPALLQNAQSKFVNYLSRAGSAGASIVGMPDISVIHSSVASEQDAVQIADALIGKRLAACVRISPPVTSTYLWQGKVENVREWHLTIKTTTAACARAVTWLEQHHPYDVPEIIWSTYQCTKPYADWANDVVE